MKTTTCTPRSWCLLLALAALLGGASAAGATDLAAQRAWFERDSAAYGTGEVANLTLAYAVAGETGSLSDVMVEVRLNSTERVVRARYRIRQVAVPQPTHHFTMPLSLRYLGLAPGDYTVEVEMDPEGKVGETERANNVVTTTLKLVESPGEAAPATEEKIRPAESRSVLSREGKASAAAMASDWSFPLEAGYHPAYGWTSAELHFPHPAWVLKGRVPESVTLVIAGRPVGDPFRELGDLDVSVRMTSDQMRPCAGEVGSFRVPPFAGSTQVDLMSFLRGRRSVPGAEDCEKFLSVTISFPGSKAPEGGRGSLFLVDAEQSWLDVR